MEHIKYCEFTIETIVDKLLNADSKNCPLLRKAVMTFELENAHDVLSSNAFRNIPCDQGILQEILSILIVNRGKNTGVDPDEYEQHSVNKLRNLLWDYGLDMDGSCQTLINRLMKKKLDEIEAQKSEENEDESSCSYFISLVSTV